MTATNLGLNGQPTQFLGAYVKHVSSSLGLSINPSSANITLVEDRQNGINFEYPDVGTYYTLSVGPTWEFSGIVTKYEKDVENIGGRTIRVTMSDPREVMQNAPMIIAPGSYAIAETIADTNLSVIDIFGAYNIAGAVFNISGWNEAGMTYARIVSALHGENVLFGSTLVPIARQVLKAWGEQYRFDLSEVSDRVDPNYRINTNLVSVGNFLEDLASKNSFDWYVTSSRASDGIIDVVVKIIDRSEDSTTLLLQDFLDAHPEKVISATSGIELRNELSCIVLQGAPVEEMQRVSIAGLANEPIDLVPESGSSSYIMTENEMRVVLAGKNQWETWLSVPSEYGGGNGLSRYGGVIKNNWLQSIVSNNTINLISEIKKGNLIKNSGRSKRYFDKEDDEIDEEIGEHVIVGKIYEKLRGHAESTYGKRWVHEDVFDEIIESCWTRDVVDGDNDPYEHFRQQDGRTRAFLEFVVQESGTTLDLGISTLTQSFGNQAVFRNVTAFGKTFERILSDNLLEAGAVLNLNNVTVNLGNVTINMDRTAYTFNRSYSGASSDRTSLYCACTVDKDGVVRIESPLLEAKPSAGEILNLIVSAADNSSGYVYGYQARIDSLNERIEELDAQIAQLEILIPVSSGNSLSSAQSQLDRAEARREELIRRRNDTQATVSGINEVVNGTDADGNEQNSVENLLRGIKRILGPDSFNMHPRAYQPRYLYVPTRSRFTRYGPVFPSNLNTESEGKLEIVNDDGFAPWEFGSVSLMIEAMQLKVDNSISPQREVFSGQIEVEGYPLYNIGDALEKNANINNISISFGDGGVKTTYQLQTFTRKFGQFSKEDWTRIALFANNGGFRTLPQRISSFIENHRIHVNRQFTGRGSSGGNLPGGARTFE